MQKIKTFDLNTKSISEAAIFVQDSLSEYGLEPKALIKSTLATEEAIGSLVSHAAGDGKLRVNVRKFLGNITVELSAPGDSYSLSEEMSAARLDIDDEVGPNVQDTIRNILLRSVRGDLDYAHKNGYNRIRITIEKNGRLFLYLTLAAMLAGAVIGLLLSSVAPESVNSAIDGYILTPVKTMYLNALKAVVAPVVFLSITTCISGFTDLSELGRIGGRIFALYMSTTVIAVCVGMGTYFLFKPGSAGLAAAAAGMGSAAGSADTEISLMNTLINIVPSNFVAPFLESNMSQLIFLAIICGIGVGMIGQYSQILRPFFTALYELFMKITIMIIRLMPIAVFCSTASMLIQLGIKTLVSVLGMFATFLVALLFMIAIYSLMMLLIGRLSPIPFLKKYSPVMLQVFSLASSNASIPVNMEACDKKLGVSSKVYSLSIPLGATINMDGTCVLLAVFALSLAKIYGVALSPHTLLMTAVTIIILSVGAPGIPGAGIICLSVLIVQLGVPVDAMGLVMGIAPLVGMFLTTTNCAGDVAVSTIVAKNTGELDLEKYNA